MTKLIKFIPYTSDDQYLPFVEVPKPSVNFIPEWWKKQDLKAGTEMFNDLSFKACVPFLDSLTSGYMIYTHQDIVVSQDDNGKPFLSWPMGPDPAVVRSVYQNLPVPVGHSDLHFAWKITFGFELPKGYSILITHPLNRFDLPFTTVSGIVDEGVPWGGTFTFWIKDNFEGIIPKGTPIAQMIPFKGENWKSEKADYLIEYAKSKAHERRTTISGYYKKFIHRKKKFE
jgi:hypothetical protein